MPEINLSPAQFTLQLFPAGGSPLNFTMAAGLRGAKGDAGSNGQGVPAGGSTNQILAKKTGTNFDTEWTDHVLDEDDFSSDSAIKPPSQQSAKAFIEGKIVDEDDFASDDPDRAPSQQSTKAYVDAADALKIAGPASATDSAILLADGTTGKLAKDSAVTISTDGAFASDSDAKVPTEQAVGEYVTDKLAQSVATAKLYDFCKDLALTPTLWTLNDAVSAAFGQANQGLYVDADEGYIYEKKAVGDDGVIVRYVYQATAGTLTPADYSLVDDNLGHQGLSRETATGRFWTSSHATTDGQISAVRFTYNAGSVATNVQIFQFWDIDGPYIGWTTPAVSDDQQYLIVSARDDSNTTRYIKVFDLAALIAAGPGDHTSESDTSLVHSWSYKTQEASDLQAIAEYKGFVFVAESQSGVTNPHATMRVFTLDGLLIDQNVNFNLGDAANRIAGGFNTTYEIEGLSFAALGSDDHKTLLVSYNQDGGLNAVFPLGPGSPSIDLDKTSQIPGLYTTRGLQLGWPTAMTLDGDVPLYQMHGTSQAWCSWLFGCWNSSATSETNLKFYKSASNDIGGTRATVADGTNIANINCYADDGTSDVGSSGCLIEVGGTVATGKVPGRWQWYAADLDGTLNNIFRMEGQTKAVEIQGAGGLVATAPTTGLGPMIKSSRSDTGDMFQALRGSTVAYGVYVSSSNVQLAASNGFNACLSVRSGASGSPEAGVIVAAGGAAFYPGADNAMTWGKSGNRISVVYAATGTINTSDEREKQQVSAIDDRVLDAWGEMEFVQYKWNDAVEKKGDKARWHFGVITQRFRDALIKHGVKSETIAALCYDEWPDEFEPVMATRKKTRAIKNPLYNEKKHPAGLKFRIEEYEEEYDTGEKKLVRKAGNRWGVRYEQCLVLESAYNRRELARLKEALRR
jgi:hypothetical protein